MNLVKQQKKINNFNNFKEIFDFYYKYANEPFKDSNAQNMLALLYAHGLDSYETYNNPEPDYTRQISIKLLWTAAKQDNSYALYNLVRNDIVSDKSEKLSMLKRSAELGNTYAHGLLSSMYLANNNYKFAEFHARLALKNKELAYSMMDVASIFYALKNYSKAMELCGELLFSPLKIDKSEPLKLMKELIIQDFFNSKIIHHIEKFIHKLSFDNESVDSFVKQVAAQILFAKDDETFIPLLFEIGCNLGQYKMRIQSNTLLHTYESLQKIKYYILYKLYNIN